MHAERINASRKYHAALKVVRVAEMGSDLAAWVSADAKLAEARTALIAAEARFPTKQESSREQRLLEMSNRGIRK